MALTSKTALIIDDAPEMRMLMRKILENSGLIVKETATITEAFEILKTWLPHIILLDLKLGAETGFSFLDFRKSNPALSHVPVIVVSGSNDGKTVTQAVVAGANDYLIKPFVASRLTQKIRKVLRDRDFLKRQFEPEDQPEVLAEVNATITQIYESSITIEAQMKVAPNQELHLTSTEFARLGIESNVFISDTKPSQNSTTGFYLSRIKVLGLKEPITRKMK